MAEAVFEALADPMRRRIVQELQGGGRSVGSLVDVVDIRQSGVSRHLRILREAGFVDVEARGQERIYSLRAEPFQALDDWLAVYRDLWEGRLDRLAAELGRRRRATGGGGQDGRG